MADGTHDFDVTPVDGTRVVRARRPVPVAHSLGPPGGRGGRRRPDRKGGFPRALALVLAGSLVLLSVLLIVQFVFPSAFGGLRNTAATHNRTIPRARHHSTNSHPVHKVHKVLTSSGPGPVLNSLSPTQAKAGSTIVLSGSGFFSASHQVVARIDGQPAPTSCPTTQRCLVVLPAAPKGATQASVEVVTESGRSNTLTIHYG